MIIGFLLFVISLKILKIADVAAHLHFSIFSPSSQASSNVYLPDGKAKL